MSYRKLFWGVILILSGTLFILKNLDVIWFSWHDIWQFWPVFIIIWGVSLLPIKSLYRFLLSLAAIVLGIILINQYGENSSGFHWRNDDGMAFHQHSGRNNNNRISMNNRDQNGFLMEAMDESIRTAELNMQVGAGNFEISGTTNNLIECNVEQEYPYTLKSRIINSSATVDLSMEETEWRGKKFTNNVDIRLHPDPEWSIDLDIGAADLNMDLRPFKVWKIKIDGGAASMDFTIGNRAHKIKAEVDAGATSITFHIPEDMGCEVHSESFLLGKSFQGLEKIRAGYYQSPGFDQAKKTISIDLETAISSFNIQRY
ncbi:MAG: DUF5668 domain-containing protein [Bacteroidales bacterium]|nr:DUF5668 domain-containing protein [Bacteroidales bacterium]MDD3962052.1 DUF5668 domain-containing protein [Bacteroidales bacterium]